MKRCIQFTLAAVLAFAGLVAAVPAAHAGNLILRAGGSEDPASAAATRVVNTGTNHRYITTDFATGAESCTLFHFGVFTDYTPGAQITGQILGTTNGTSTTAMQLRLDLACVTPTIDNYNTTALTAGTAFTFTPLGTSGALQAANIANGGLDETTPGCTSSDAFVLRVCRTLNDGGSANANTFKLVHVRLEW